MTSTELHLTALGNNLVIKRAFILFHATSTSSCGHSTSYRIIVPDPPAQPENSEPDSSDADGESSEENVPVRGVLVLVDKDVLGEGAKVLDKAMLKELRLGSGRKWMIIVSPQQTCPLLVMRW